MLGLICWLADSPTWTENIATSFWTQQMMSSSRISEQGTCYSLRWSSWASQTISMKQACDQPTTRGQLARDSSLGTNLDTILSPYSKHRWVVFDERPQHWMVKLPAIRCTSTLNHILECVIFSIAFDFSLAMNVSLWSLIYVLNLLFWLGF